MEDGGCRGFILCAVKIVASLNCKCNSLITCLDSLYIKICRNGLVSESSENQALYASYLYTSRCTKWDCYCGESWPQTFKMVVSPWTERLIICIRSFKVHRKLSDQHANASHYSSWNKQRLSISKYVPTSMLLKHLSEKCSGKGKW